MNTTITQNTVVQIHYTMTTADGEQIDSTLGDQPMIYLHGHQNIVPGLEAALEGAAVGAELAVVVAPADAYGEVNESSLLAFSRGDFPEDMEIEPDAKFATRDEDGELIAMWVVEVKADEVLMTTDHPLAGVELHYDVSVVDIRDATEKEIERGGLGCSCC